MAPTQADLRVMVDANILIAGSVWPRWPYEVLQHALHGDFQLVLSNYILRQARRHIQARFPAYIEPFNGVLQACRYELIADPSKVQVSQHSDLVRDPTDVPVALAAINARVDYLVSEDKDLTVQDESTAELRLCTKTCQVWRLGQRCLPLPQLSSSAIISLEHNYPTWSWQCILIHCKKRRRFWR